MKCCPESTTKAEVASRILLAVGLFFLTLLLMLVNAYQIPEKYAPADYAYTLAGDCDDITSVVPEANAGQAGGYYYDEPANEDLSIASLPEATKICARMMIEERSWDVVTTFVEFHIGALLLYIYLIHQVAQSFKTKDKLSVTFLLAEIVFMLCLAVETFMLYSKITWTTYFAPLDGSDWKWEELYGSDYEDMILSYNAPFNDEMWVMLETAAAVRIFGFIAFLCLVIADACSDLGTLEGAKGWMERIALGVHHAYVFMFTIILTSCGMSVLLFFRQSQADETEYSYLAGTQCDDVTGLTQAELGSHVAERCVEEFVIADTTAKKQDLFTVYVTILIFYLLQVNEATDFVKDRHATDDETGKEDLWYSWSRMYVAVVIIFETLFFLINLIQIHDAESGALNLKYNNPMWEAADSFLYSTVVLRFVSMGGFYVIYLLAVCRADKPSRASQAELTQSKTHDTPV